MSKVRDRGRLKIHKEEFRARISSHVPSKEKEASSEPASPVRAGRGLIELLSHPRISTFVVTRRFLLCPVWVQLAVINQAKVNPRGIAVEIPGTYNIAFATATMMGWWVTMTPYQRLAHARTPTATARLCSPGPDNSHGKSVLTSLYWLYYSVLVS
ncbi:hypothetical protein J6590_023103 [Homalodisca vitripennis]|nr:hypothetical protein J6590_023103 [Homalodisca vitripennis]